MPDRRGRAGRELNELELIHLKLLLELHEQGHDYARARAEHLEDFTLRCRESGASARSMAAQLGVSWSTVQRWTKHAKQRRDRG
jgi:hypothetical protein